MHGEAQGLRKVSRRRARGICRRRRHAEVRGVQRELETVLAELIDNAIGVQIAAPARDELEQPGGDRFGNRARRVDERGDEGRLCRTLDGVGRNLQEAHRDHRLSQHLERLPEIELIPSPCVIDKRWADAGNEHESEADQADAPRIDVEIEEVGDSRQQEQLRQRDFQRDELSLQRAIALDLLQIGQWDGRAGLSNDEESEEGDAAVSDVASAEQLQFDERQRMQPLVEQEQRYAQRADEGENADELGVEPVEPVALKEHGAEGAEADDEQQDASPVENAKALVMRVVLDLAIPDERACERRRRHGLKEDEPPIDDIGPQRREARRHSAGEAGGEGVNGQAVDAHIRNRKNAQSRGHEQRNEKAAREALQKAQRVDRLDVGAEGDQHARHPA